jgi:hypothetical protein
VVSADDRLTLADVWARVTRAYEALQDGDVGFAYEILRDLDEDLYVAVTSGRYAA